MIGANMRGTIVHTGHTAAIYVLTPSSDGALFSGGAEGALLSWHPARAGEVRVVARLPAPVYSIHPRADGSLFVGTAAGELFALDQGTKQVLHRISAHAKGIFSILPLNDDRLACAGGDGSLSIWKVKAPGPARCELLRNIPLCDAKLRGLALSAAGDRLAVACGDGVVRVLETELFNEVANCTGHAEGANSVVFHPSRPVLLSGGKDGHLRLWDTKNSYRKVLSIAAHRSTIYQLAFDPKGERCVSVSRDKTVKVWNANTFDPMERLDAQHGGHSHSVNAACWMNGDLFTGGDDRKLLRWSDT